MRRVSGAGLAACLFGVLCLASCSDPVSKTGVPTGPGRITFHADDNPDTLSAWGLFTLEDGQIEPDERMVTYELNAPLFSDYAQKWRTIYVPEGESGTYDARDAFEFPIGTIITKTFYYPLPEAAEDRHGDQVLKPTDATYQTGINGLDMQGIRLIETRLLVRRADGWDALPYVWNADQSEAVLRRAGADLSLTMVSEGESTAFNYSVPNVNQCAGCHATDYNDRAIKPIGVRARHLNRDFGGAGGEMNQLRRLADIGYIDGLPALKSVPKNADWDDASLPIAARARSYLDINCSHCHSDVGPARTSGLWLMADVTELRQWGICKPPVAAGRGTGDRGFDIMPGEPHQSILTYRMESLDPGEMMPEIGRSLMHEEGVALISDWISGMTETCNLTEG